MKLITNHIDYLSQTGNYQLTGSDKKSIDQIGLDEWILKRLLSKKFRKTKAVVDCIDRTKKAINLRLKKDEPLTVVFPQGGYKLWRLPSSPEADWAEFFNISYVLEYLAPIAAAYKPGINLVYYMHTLLMEAHDNLSTKEINDYVKSFQILLDYFSKNKSNNIQISILKDADIYSRTEYFKALEEGVVKAGNVYKDLPKEKKESMKRMAELNIKWHGVERWDKYSRKERDDQLIKSALYEMSAVNNLPRVVNKVKADNNILLFTVATPQFIGIGSTKTSIAKYWVGFGVLEKREDKFYQRVLTPSQFEKACEMTYTVDKLDLSLGNNFSEIRIYPESSL